MSIFWSIDKSETEQHIITYVQLVILAWVLWDLYKTPKAVRSVLQAYIFGAYVTVASTIYNYLTDKPISIYSQGRFTGASLNAVDLALVLSLGIPVAWYLAVTAVKGEKGYFQRLVNFAFVPAAFFAAMLSATRTTLFVLIPSILYIVGTANKLKLSSRILIVTVIIGAMIILLPYLPHATTDRLSTTWDSISSGDLGGRVSLWKASFLLFAEHPILGIGSGTLNIPAAIGAVAHNSYLSVLTELGLIGFLLFAVMLLIVFNQAIHQPTGYTSLWLAVLSIWAIGVFMLSWEFKKPTWLFLSLVVISANIINREKQASIDRKATARLKRRMERRLEETMPTLLQKMLALCLVLATTSCTASTLPTQRIPASPIPNQAIHQKTAITTQIPAFPGAEGFGATTTGGRGGKVIEVTSLKNDGAGSLRAAVNAEGPRIVVFRVGGTIELKTSLEVTYPYITIAGQTAPGGGITLKNQLANQDSPLIIRTHDVVVRYIRSRPGPGVKPTSNGDAIEILGKDANRIVIDHCSFSWAVDEVASTWYEAHDITIQWSIIAEGLYCSTHEKGCHSMGMVLGSEGSGNISIHHNLFAHNHERNPLIKTSGPVDIVNNIVFNPGGTPAVVTDDKGKPLVNYINNYYKPGADSDLNKYNITAQSLGGPGIEIFVQGNIEPHRPSDDLAEWLAVKPEARQWIVLNRQYSPSITTQSALEAYIQVLANAGANIGLDSQGGQYLKQDSVDVRILENVRRGTGRIIDDPSEVGGWPALSGGTPFPDSDHDGMPDEWEIKYGLNPNDPSDGPIDIDGDGYTNVEEFINSTNPNG